MAPFESEYGSGHSLIIIKSLMPSCFNVKASAANRLSFSVIRVTYDLRSVREARNDAVLPIIVPDATMSHLPFRLAAKQPCTIWTTTYPLGTP